MENFLFNYISNPVPPEEVDIWLRINNIIPEKLELFYDFTVSLTLLIRETYLGDDDTTSETKIILSNDDKINHFIWCFNKVIENFKNEGIEFTKDGEHFDYFKTFFLQVFYNQKDSLVRTSLVTFFNQLFDLNEQFSKSDLDMIAIIYKSLNKSMKILD